MAKKSNNTENTQADIWGIKQSEAYDSLTEEEKEAVELFVPKESYFVQSTKNYDMFKIMDKNREIIHDKPIFESILNIGLLPIPIIVNEFMEIVDGQGRFSACKQLGKPIYYMIVEGLRINHVITMNSISKKWATRDYIRCYATGDDKRVDYEYLNKLINKYSSTFTNSAIYAACGLYDGSTPKAIRTGALAISEATYFIAINKLEFLKKFYPYMKKRGQKGKGTICGKHELLYRAILFCYDNDEVDNDRLVEKFEKYYYLVKGIVSVEQAISEIDTVYNTNRGKKPLLDIKAIYRAYINNSYQKNFVISKTRGN